MTPRTRRFIAGWEIVSALSSIVILIVASARTDQTDAWLVFAPILCLAMATGVAGWRLWNDASWGRELTSIIQLLLSVDFVQPGLVAYGLSLGLGFDISLGTTPDVLDKRVHLLWEWQPTGSGYLSIDLCAVAILIILHRATRRDGNG